MVTKFDEARAELVRRNASFTNAVVKIAKSTIKNDVEFASFTLAKNGVKGFVYDENQTLIEIDNKLSFDIIRGEVVNNLIQLPQVAMMIATLEEEIPNLESSLPALLCGARIEVAAELAVAGETYVNLNGTARATAETNDRFYYHLVSIELRDTAITDFLAMLKIMK